MTDYSEDRRILKQAIIDNKLVVFVGAGASFNSGMRLWKEAIQIILTKINSTSIGENEMLKIPQVYFNARGEKEYNELVKDIYKYDDKLPNKIHDFIVKLNPCNIITTNYDDFLEKAFIANGEFLDVVQKDTDIPYCKNSRMIIKMHGGFTYNNFVFKEDDYLNYSNDFTLIEIFIKALIAKNTILFIGYSYNDPDTKQIFNWVKNILGDNFQRAYFIDAQNIYDLHILNYYKNLGINIIYSSERTEKFDKNKIYDNTLELLEYIVTDEQENDKINIIYNEIKHLFNLNYVLSKHISSIFYNLNVRVEDYKLRLLDDQCVDFFTKLSNDSLLKEFNILSNIKKVFDYKTIITDAYTYDKQSQEQINLCKFKDMEYPKLYKDIDDQNFINILNYPDSIITTKELDNQQQLSIAYSFYELHEYQKCYVILKKVSLSYKQQQNYIWYYISEFNRINVGRRILNLTEVDKIDLSDILYNNALKDKKENKILKELEDFKLCYNTLSYVITSSDKIIIEANTKYSIYSGTPNIDKLEIYILDFYNYIKLNYLMIDIFPEVKEIFKQYINAVFYSHSKDEKEDPDNGMFGPSTA